MQSIDICLPAHAINASLRYGKVLKDIKLSFIKYVVYRLINESLSHLLRKQQHNIPMPTRRRKINRRTLLAILPLWIQPSSTRILKASTTGLSVLSPGLCSLCIRPCTSLFAAMCRNNSPSWLMWWTWAPWSMKACVVERWVAIGACGLVSCCRRVGCRAR